MDEFRCRLFRVSLCRDTTVEVDAYVVSSDHVKRTIPRSFCGSYIWNSEFKKVLSCVAALSTLTGMENYDSNLVGVVLFT